jgi:tetratricopeptide (TPR) repeat protein
LEELRFLLKVMPYQPTFHALLAQANECLATGDFDSALRYAMRAQSDNPTSTEASRYVVLIRLVIELTADQAAIMAEYAYEATDYFEAHVFASRAYRLSGCDATYLEVYAKCSDGYADRLKGFRVPHGSTYMSDTFCSRAWDEFRYYEYRAAYMLYNRALLDRPFDPTAARGKVRMSRLLEASSEVLTVLAKYEERLGTPEVRERFKERVLELKGDTADLSLEEWRGRFERGFDSAAQ